MSYVPIHIMFFLIHMYVYMDKHEHMYKTVYLPYKAHCASINIWMGISLIIIAILSKIDHLFVLNNCLRPCNI